VDLDEAGNGICLPTSDIAKTSALKHGADEMHGDRYIKALLDRCQAAETNGPNGVEDMLSFIRGELANGRAFW
jgi:hypothetical protein